MEGIGRYNLGYSAREAVRCLKHRFGMAVPEKTFRRWYTAHTGVHPPYHPGPDDAPH
jgi:hypothetical protein